MCLQYNTTKLTLLLFLSALQVKKSWYSTCPYFSLLAVSGTLHFVYTFMLKDILMYQDLIRNELNERRKRWLTF